MATEVVSASRLLGVMEPTVSRTTESCPLCGKPGPWKTTQAIRFVDPKLGRSNSLVRNVSTDAPADEDDDYEDWDQVPVADPECRHQLWVDWARSVWVSAAMRELYLSPPASDCNLSDAYPYLCYTHGVHHDCTEQRPEKPLKTKGSE